VLTTDQKGAVAETAIAHLALKLGVSVFAPVAEGERYDFIFARGPTLLRVQCKWAVNRGEVVVVTCRTSRRKGNGFHWTTYSPSEVDLIAAYCASIERCFLLPPFVFDGQANVTLRLTPARNNQRLGIRWADDFDFAATLDRHLGGAIAQLGERLAGSQKGTGSSPVGSTPKAASGGLRLFSA
jgi:hypothetical protein